MANANDPRKCVVLVPTAGAIEPKCEEGLRQLERRGYPVWRVRGYSAIDLARNQMASDALAKGYDELMWIDSDMGFQLDEVERLRAHPHPLVAALCPLKGVRRLAAAFLPQTQSIRFGTHGGLVEVRYVGFGFVLTRRTVFDSIRQGLHLPTCNERFGKTLVPWFAPMVHDDGLGHWYLSEDYAFCERAHQVGISILIDSSLRVWHVGSYAYSWEDAGGERQRFDDYIFHFNDAAPPAINLTAPPPAPVAAVPTAAANDRPPRNALHAAVGPLPTTFPRLRAYCVSYPANEPSLQETLKDFRRCDWGEEPMVFLQPDDWPTSKVSASRNYRRALEHAYEEGCDFALILEDDVRVNRRLRHNLTNNPLVRRDQCDYLSLYIPDLIVSPWVRQERHLGYRLAKALYSGPNRLWERNRIWGSQGYLLSRRFLRAALERWDRLSESQDTRVLSVCSELRLPLWYTWPCLVEHMPLASAFATPTAHAPDFDAEYRWQRQDGFQPPENIPGWLSQEEGKLLWEHAAGRRVLELGTALGRSTVCLAQQARQVVSIDRMDQSEAEEWCQRYEVHDRVAFHRGDVGQIVSGLRQRFDLVFVDTGHDTASVRRDIEAALPVLETGGRMAFHDYPDPGWPDVRQVVDDYAQRLGWRRIAQADYLGVFRTSTE